MPALPVLVLPVAGALLVSCAEPGSTTDAGAGGSATVPPVATAPTTTAISAETTEVRPIPPGEQVDPGAISTPFPEQPQDVVAVPDTQVDASALPPGHPTQVWTDTPGTTLGFYGLSSGCHIPESSLVGEDAATVTVQLRKVTTSAGPCTAELGYHPQGVALAIPLGERSVVLTYAGD